ncbi:MAG: hypothetical protein ACYTGF_02480 [Planctomycetota bacterium]
MTSRNRPVAAFRIPRAAHPAALLVIVLATSAPAIGTVTYETSLSHRPYYNYAWTDIIHTSSLPFVDYFEATSGCPSYDCFWLSGPATSTPGELRVAPDMNMEGGGGNNGRYGLLSSRWESVSALVFESIDNPGSGGQAQVRLDLEWFISWSASGTAEYCDPPPVGSVYAVRCSSDFGWATTEAAFSGPDVPQGGQTITGPTVTVDLDVPRNWTTSLSAELYVGVGLNCGDQTTQVDLESILRLGPLNPDGSIGPVFVLPPGITANAPSIGLVNNYFQAAASPCPGDLDGSGDVGVTDFLALLAVWGTDPGGPPDFDGDGDVGITDFLLLLANWGSCP